MSTDILFGLVLVVAVAAGWLLGRYAGLRKRTDGTPSGLSEEYFRGLNYLLNEDTDKALEVFIRMVEVDSETVETHFALGSLFRKRGEVDRAIRIHQNLIARPNLRRDHREYALHELGEDYMRAGLLDRAENLFSDLTRSRSYVTSALRHLIAIYEQQRDWDQAISAAGRLEQVDGRSRHHLVAHYLCELAEKADAANLPRQAAQLVRRARSTDPVSVRASIMAGTLKDADGDAAGALALYERVVEQDPAYTAEVLSAIAGCHRKLGEPGGFDAFLAKLRDKHPECIPYVAMGAFYEPGLHSTELMPYISRYLETYGRGLARLLDRLTEKRSLDPRLELDAARELVRLLLEDHPRYLCGDCGFGSSTLYWQCPSCRSWGSTKPHADLPYIPSASAVPDGNGTEQR